MSRWAAPKANTAAPSAQRGGYPMNLLATVLPWAIGAFVIALALNAWRLLRGPSLPDRILALDTLHINTLALLVLLGIQLRSELYFEAALVIAMLGFVSTVVLSKYVLRGTSSNECLACLARCIARVARRRRRGVRADRLVGPGDTVRFSQAAARPDEGDDARRGLRADRLGALVQRRQGRAEPA